jgi:hypothetical protein
VLGFFFKLVSHYWNFNLEFFAFFHCCINHSTSLPARAAGRMKEPVGRLEGWGYLGTGFLRFREVTFGGHMLLGWIGVWERSHSCFCCFWGNIWSIYETFFFASFEGDCGAGTIGTGLHRYTDGWVGWIGFGHGSTPTARGEAVTCYLLGAYPISDSSCSVISSERRNAAVLTNWTFHGT